METKEQLRARLLVLGAERWSASRDRTERMRIVCTITEAGGNAGMSAQAAHVVEGKGIYAVRPIGIQSDRVLQRFDTGGVQAAQFPGHGGIDGDTREIALSRLALSHWS